MYPACILHVFLMYPACILIASEDTCIHACIPHVSRMSPSYKIHLSLDAFEIHVFHEHVSLIYDIIINSRPIYLACILSADRLITLADTCIPHVSCI